MDTQELIERITNKIKSEELVCNNELSKVMEKVSRNTVKQEDWFIAVENTIALGEKDDQKDQA